MNAPLRDFLGLRPALVALLSMVVLVGIGEKMAERFLPIYLLALGGGLAAVGFINGLDNVLSAFFSWWGGALSDRIGARRSLLVFNFLAIAGFIAVLLFPRWEIVLLASILFLSWTHTSFPASMSLVAEQLPRTKRTMGVTMHSLVRRVPMALGPVAGGFCIDTWGETRGVQAAFAVALVLAVAALPLWRRMTVKEEGGSRVTPSLRETWAVMNPRLRNLLVSDVLVRFCEQIPYAFVVIWCLKAIAHPVTAVEFGVLTAIEMAAAVLVYIPVAAYADRMEKKPFVLITFVNFTLFPVALYFSHSFSWLVAAFILRGLKEFGEPTRKSLILDLAPPGREASVFGLYYLIRDGIVSVAAFGGAALWAISPAVNLFTAAACGAIGTLWFAACGKDQVSK